MGLTLFYPLESRKDISARNEESSVTTTTGLTTTTMEGPITSTTEPIGQGFSQPMPTTTVEEVLTTKTPATITTELATTKEPNKPISKTMSTIKNDLKVFEMDLNENQNLVHTSRALLAGTLIHGPSRNVFHKFGMAPDESS